MSKQNYVGQYLINTVRQTDWCRQEVGECLWQDSKNLLCAHYANQTMGTQFHSILLVPVRLAKKIKWYASFDEFYGEISSDSNGSVDITMTLKERDGFQSIRALPQDYSDDMGCGYFYPERNCVAQLARCIKERPVAGKFLAKYIAAEAVKHKARKATIETIAKMIADAGLSADEVKTMSNDTNAEGTIEMSNTNTDKTDNDLTVEQWLQVRKEAGLKIDPGTAEVVMDYRCHLDPYGVYPDIPEEYRYIGKEYFVRSPGSDIWVAGYHLPDGIWEKIRSTARDDDDF